MIKIEQLSKKYKGAEAYSLSDLDLFIAEKEIFGLLGPNGAGKTTTFYMITGMIKPTKGKIFLDTKDITQDAMYKRSRQGI